MELYWDESTYKSVTNEDLTIIDQTKAFIKLDLVKHPVMLEFLICTDDLDKGRLSLNTLKQLTIIPRDFPFPIDMSMREPRIRRIKENEEEAEEEKVEKGRHFELKERVGSMRSKLEMNQLTEDDWEEESKCEELKKQWLRDFSDIFKENLTKEDSHLNLKFEHIPCIKKFHSGFPKQTPKRQLRSGQRIRSSFQIKAGCENCQG